MFNLPDKDNLPLYGCVTGIELPCDPIPICEGAKLRSGLFKVFGTPMMAFAEPQSPNAHTPGPWIPVHGGFAFESRAELVIESLASFDGFLPSQAAWLVAVLLRMRVESPIRIRAIANVPLAELPNHKNYSALAFEASPFQLGIFRSQRIRINADDLDWLSETLPIAARLFHEERFNRAISLYDEATWTNRFEMACILLWTSVEVLFDLGAATDKTKAICSALADCVGHDRQDRDRVYGVARDLYRKRGSTVHAGGKINGEDFYQLYALIRATFRNALSQKSLPPKAPERN